MKVAIIGAGISGLYIGWKLAEQGNQVTIFEKRPEIGKMVCSGLFSEKLFDFIPKNHIQDLIENRIDYTLIHFPRKTLKVNFKKSFWVISHYELDRRVAALAEKAGVKIFLNLGLKNEDFNGLLKDYDRVIGCDGPLSVIRKGLNLPDPKFQLGLQGFTIGSSRANFVETWPTKHGFFWKIPKSKITEYGIIEEPKSAIVLLEKYIRDFNLDLLGRQSALVPQGLVLSNNKAFALCGDSMGLTKPWSGGGVIWSLTAGNLLLKNFPDFVKYNNSMKKFFRPQIIFSKLAKRVLYFSGNNLFFLLPKNYKIEGDFFLWRK